MTYSVALLWYSSFIKECGGENMEAIMIAGVAVVAISGWYSVIDLLADMGIRIRKRSGNGMTNSGFSRSSQSTLQRSVKQVAWMNI